MDERYTPPRTNQRNFALQKLNQSSNLWTSERRVNESDISFESF